MTRNRILPGRVLWSTVAVLWLVVACRWGAFGAAPRGPDSPADRYWFRVTAPVTEQGVMDPRVRAIADAFGAGRHEDCRRLAEQLLGEAQTSGLRDQAVAYVIESYLAQGEFDKARGAAGRMGPAAPAVCEDALARGNRGEKTYARVLAGPRRSVESAVAPGIRASKLLAVARLEVAAGRRVEAERGFREALDVAVKGSAGGAAATAVRSLLMLAEPRDGTNAVPDLAASLLHEYPDSYVVARESARVIGEPAFRDRGVVGLDERAAELVGETHGGPARAGIEIGEALVLLNHALPDAAQRVLETVNSQAGSEALLDARGLLASIHLQRGVEFCASQDYLMAAQEVTDALAAGTLRGPDLLNALYTLGLCYQGTDQLPMALEPLEAALRMCPGAFSQATILYQVGVCYYRAGRYEAAAPRFEEVLRLDPNGPLSEYARERARQCQEALERGG